VTGRTLKNSWEGARGEALALAVLSNLGIVTQVRREADLGVVDLHCVLARTDPEDAQVLRAERAFGVQVKSTCDDSFDGVSYGKPSSMRCASPDVRYFFQQELPILIAHVNRTTGRLRLYSTLRAWHVRMKAGWPCSLKFVPGDGAESPTPSCAHAGQASDRSCTAHCHTVRLGKPILDVEEVHMTDQECLRFSSVVAEWVRLDLDTRHWYGEGVHAAWEVCTWETNCVPEETRAIGFVSRDPKIGKENVDAALRALLPVVVVLNEQIEALGHSDAPLRTSLGALMSVLRSHDHLPRFDDET
jgi:hypothetical protein